MLGRGRRGGGAAELAIRCFYCAPPLPPAPPALPAARDPPQTSFFFGYMAIVCYGFFLLLGAVGFRASLTFVRHIYRRAGQGSGDSGASGRCIWGGHSTVAGSGWLIGIGGGLGAAGGGQGGGHILVHPLSLLACTRRLGWQARQPAAVSGDRVLPAAPAAAGQSSASRRAAGAQGGAV